MTYNEFIEFNKTKDQGPYTQKHHIIPKSIGGPDTADNIIKLSWLAHYYAHMLLAKENPDNKKLVTDFKRKGSIEQWLKKCYIFAKKGEVSPKKGKHLSEEVKQKISKAMMGHTPTNKGVPMTLEQRKKMSEAKKGKTPWNKGKKLTYESPFKGKPRSEETKKKISETLKARNKLKRGE